MNMIGQKKNNVLRLKNFILGGVKILMKGQVLKTVIKGLPPPILTARAKSDMAFFSRFNLMIR